MTKWEFEIIATALRLDGDYARMMSEPWLEGYMEAVSSMAKGMKEVNPRFDTERFYNWVIGDEK